MKIDNYDIVKLRQRITKLEQDVAKLHAAVSGFGAFFEGLVQHLELECEVTKDRKLVFKKSKETPKIIIPDLKV